MDIEILKEVIADIIALFSLAIIIVAVTYYMFTLCIHNIEVRQAMLYLICISVGLWSLTKLKVE